MSFRGDYEWQADYLPHMKRLIGEALLREGTAIEDKEQNTDLIVLRLDAVRIGCRVRRAEFFDRYPDDITIRSWRASGAKTELAKILEGWGDYLFYGFAGTAPCRLRAARLIDLEKMRWWWRDCRNAPPHREIVNPDRSSRGVAVSIPDLPKGSVVAEWGHAVRNR